MEMAGRKRTPTQGSSVEASRAEAARIVSAEPGLAPLTDRLPDGVLTDVAGGASLRN
jgi:hypothetical protein